MLGVDEARARILSALAPLPEVTVPLLSAAGLVLAEDIIADVDVPPFRNSAMDGYAVRAADVRAASPERPVSLLVIDELAAGTASTRTLGPGQAMRIMTGAPIPEGADAVVRFEETSELSEPPGERRIGRTVLVGAATVAGSNVRQAGEDMVAGQAVLARGQPLGPPEIGLLASLNRATVRVHRRPRVGILSTGDEVIDLGPPLLPGQIRNSNSYSLASASAFYGAEPVLLGVARDDVAEIRSRLHDGSQFDLVLTSGGVSVGDFDMVKRVLQEDGVVELWQVRIKPGKPLAFGHLGRTPLLGLPGNPAAALVAFLQFGRPAVRRLLGYRETDPVRLRARLLQSQENRGRRRHFVRGHVWRQGDELLVEPVGAQGSGIMSSLAQANCLIVLPEEWDHAAAGSIVEVEQLDWEHIGQAV